MESLYCKPCNLLKLLGNAFKPPLNASDTVIADKAKGNELSLICLIFFFPEIYFENHTPLQNS